MNRKVSIAIPVILLILLAVLLPLGVFAGEKTVNGITLFFPDSYSSCSPTDVITTAGADGLPIIYDFFKVEGTNTFIPLGGGNTTGELRVAFPYPDEIDGTMTFVAAINVTTSAGASTNIGAKWDITCDGEVTPTPKTPTPTPVTPTPTPVTPTPPPDGEGCTPGFWKQDQHFDSWIGAAPTDDYEQVFGVDASFNPTALIDAVWLGGGGEDAFARHSVAAFLNANSPDVEYAIDTAEIISLVQLAYSTGEFESVKDMFEFENELGCPLN